MSRRRRRPPGAKRPGVKEQVARVDQVLSLVRAAAEAEGFDVKAEPFDASNPPGWMRRLDESFFLGEVHESVNQMEFRDAVSDWIEGAEVQPEPFPPDCGWSMFILPPEHGMCDVGFYVPPEHREAGAFVVDCLGFMLEEKYGERFSNPWGAPFPDARWLSTS